MTSELRIFDALGDEVFPSAPGEAIVFGVGNDHAVPHVRIDQDFSSATQISACALEILTGPAAITLRVHQRRPGWCEMRPYQSGGDGPTGRVRIDSRTEVHTAAPRVDLSLFLGPGSAAIELGHLEFQATEWRTYSGTTSVVHRDPEPEVWLRWIVAAYQVRLQGRTATVENTWQWLVDNAGEVGDRPQGNAASWAAGEAAERWRLTNTSGGRPTWPEVQRCLAERPDLLTPQTIAFVMDGLRDRTWRALRDPSKPTTKGAG